MTGPVLSRALGDAGRGDLAAVLVPTQLAGWGLVLGVPYASAMLIRRYSRPTLVNGSWAIAAVIGIPACAVLYVIAPLLLAGHPDSTVGWFRFGLVGTALGIPAMTVLHLRLITKGASAGLSAARSMHLLANSALVVALAVGGRLTLWSALASWLTSYVVSRIVILTALRAWPSGVATRVTVRDQLMVGRAHAVVTVATISLGRIDQVFLSLLGTSSELGLYAVAATAAQLSLPLARGFADVVLPDVFARPGDDISRRATALIFGISAMIGLGSAAIAPWFIPALFGEDFSDSVPLVVVVDPRSGAVQHRVGDQRAAPRRR